MKLEALMCIVERGKADAVVKKAVTAGAGGATIFFARGAGEKTFSFFASLSVDAAKEVAIILVSDETKAAGVDAIVDVAELDKHGKGLLFVIPVSEIYGVKRFQSDNAEK